MPCIAKVNTYTRIINASLALFNEEDEHNISTNHIVAHLGISPGDLYYHLRDKDEIIVQSSRRHSEVLFTYPNEAVLPSNVEDSINYTAGIYDVTWEHRFPFSDVNTLPACSAELSGEHSTFTQVKVSPLLVNLLTQFNGLNIISADQTAMNDLVVSMWMVTKYWFDFDSSLHDRAKLTEDSKVWGISRTLNLLHPYLPPEHRIESDQKIGSNC